MLIPDRCMKCEINPIQRLMACEDCNDGINFDKIFKLLIKVKSGEERGEKMNPKCPNCLLEVDSVSDGKIAWWTCVNCGIDFSNTKPPLRQYKLGDKVK